MSAAAEDAALPSYEDGSDDGFLTFLGNLLNNDDEAPGLGRALLDPLSLTPSSLVHGVPSAVPRAVPGIALSLPPEPPNVQQGYEQHQQHQQYLQQVHQHPHQSGPDATPGSWLPCGGYAAGSAASSSGAAGSSFLLAPLGDQWPQQQQLAPSAQEGQDAGGREFADFQAALATAAAQAEAHADPFQPWYDHQPQPPPLMEEQLCHQQQPQQQAPQPRQPQLRWQQLPEASGSTAVVAALPAGKVSGDVLRQCALHVLEVHRTPPGERWGLHEGWPDPNLLGGGRSWAFVSLGNPDRCRVNLGGYQSGPQPLWLEEGLYGGVRYGRRCADCDGTYTYNKRGEATCAGQGHSFAKVTCITLAYAAKPSDGHDYDEKRVSTKKVALWVRKTGVMGWIIEPAGGAGGGGSSGGGGAAATAAAAAAASTLPAGEPAAGAVQTSGPVVQTSGPAIVQLHTAGGGSAIEGSRSYGNSGGGGGAGSGSAGGAGRPASADAGAGRSGSYGSSGGGGGASSGSNGGRGGGDGDGGTGGGGGAAAVPGPSRRGGEEVAEPRAKLHRGTKPWRDDCGRLLAFLRDTAAFPQLPTVAAPCTPDSAEAAAAAAEAAAAAAGAAVNPRILELLERWCALLYGIPLEHLTAMRMDNGQRLAHWLASPPTHLEYPEPKEQPVDPDAPLPQAAAVGMIVAVMRRVGLVRWQGLLEARDTVCKATPLHRACRFGHRLEVLRLMLQSAGRRALLTVTDKAWMAYHTAFRAGHPLAGEAHLCRVRQLAAELAGAAPGPDSGPGSGSGSDSDTAPDPGPRHLLVYAVNSKWFTGRDVETGQAPPGVAAPYGMDLLLQACGRLGLGAPEALPEDALKLKRRVGALTRAAERAGRMDGREAAARDADMRG